jgi:hypothetical protein
LIEHGDHFHCVEALVDNGAARSILPYTAAAKLGLEGTLRRTRGVKGPNGRRFAAWRTKAVLSAQIATLIQGDPHHIGPVVTLDPWFVKPPRLLRNRTEPRPLAGRKDFLRHFKISSNEETLALEWDE